MYCKRNTFRIASMGCAVSSTGWEAAWGLLRDILPLPWVTPQHAIWGYPDLHQVYSWWKSKQPSVMPAEPREILGYSREGLCRSHSLNQLLPFPSQECLLPASVKPSHHPFPASAGYHCWWPQVESNAGGVAKATFLMLFTCQVSQHALWYICDTLLQCRGCCAGRSTI